MKTKAESIWFQTENNKVCIKPLKSLFKHFPSYENLHNADSITQANCWDKKETLQT